MYRDTKSGLPNYDILTTKFYRGEQAEITAHIADFREHYAIGLKFDETLQAYKWADGTTPADWGFSNWGSGDPGQ